MSPAPVLDGLSSADLHALVIELLGQVADLQQTIIELQATVAAQADEIARLKKLKGRPRFKPSGMEPKASAPPTGGPRRGPKGSKANRLVITEDRIVSADVPEGLRFKGYADFLVQELRLVPRVIRIRRERWQTPDGRMITAPMPEGVSGHFGPELRRFILFQHSRCQVTVERLTAQLTSLGLVISKRQMIRLLNAHAPSFVTEAREVLRSGLETARWLSIDDTGARHQNRNGVCTSLGNDQFTAFATTGSKSRLNFLELLRAGYPDYVINAAAVAYMRARGLAGPVIAQLTDHPDHRFADEASWMAHLEALGVSQRADWLDPRRLASEGALWGAIQAHGLVPDTVILSDEAGQFALAPHALCWVHAERLVHKLETFNEPQHVIQQRLRQLIWRFYADLKTYRTAPSRQRRAALRARFDRIFRRRTGFVMLDRLLARLHAHKAELLRVLDRPEVPLHTNATERDLRAYVIKRKISGGTQSDTGRAMRDALLGLMHSCQKLGVSFWDYLGSRLGIAGTDVPSLPDLVRRAAAA
jgi:Transposase IS66 family